MTYVSRAGEKLEHAIKVFNFSVKDLVCADFGSNTGGFVGDNFLTGPKYTDQSGEHEIKVNGAFVHIGMVPNSKIVSDDVQKNNFGEIVVNKSCETNIPGLYAAGDVTDVPFKQIVIAAGQGTTALLSAVNYLNRLK